MSTTLNITDWNRGEDFQLAFEMLDSDSVPVDVSARTYSWILKRFSGVKLTKTSGSGIAVTGAYNADRDLNTQRVVVTLDRADSVNLAHGDYDHELARTDTGAWTKEVDGTVTLGVTHHS